MALFLLYLLIFCGGVGILCGEVQIALGGGSGAALVIYVLIGWVFPLVCIALVTARKKLNAALAQTHHLPQDKTGNETP